MTVELWEVQKAEVSLSDLFVEQHFGDENLQHAVNME